ncbi:MAG: hypothetical protein R6V36_12430, partial [Psychroflexus sp.]
MIENNEGRDHDYIAKVTLIQGSSNITKLVREISVPADERRECTVRFLLTPEEIEVMASGNFSKVSIHL